MINVEQVMRLRQAKNELERKVQDQEEELDEQAGTIQQLEQVGGKCCRLFVFVCQQCGYSDTKQIAVIVV